jgi:hypothetical protein
MFQMLNDEKPDASERKEKLVEGGWIVGGLVGVAAIVWFLIRHTIA